MKAATHDRASQVIGDGHAPALLKSGMRTP